MSKNLPSYRNLVRGSFFLLFIISCILCLVNPTREVQTISGLSFFGIIADFVLEICKQPPQKDFSEEFEKMKLENAELVSQFKEIKNDLSVAKIGVALGHMRK